MRTVRYLLTVILALILFDSSDCLSQADDSKKFRMAVIKYKTVEKVKETYTPMVNYIAKKLGKQPELTIIMDESLAYELSDDKFDLGVFPPFPYLKAKTDFPELEVFASHIVSGKETYKGAIYVLESSGIESFMDLKDKNFLFVKPTSTSGFKYPKGILREHNIDIDEFFNYDFSGGHDESITALLEGKAEGIAIDTKAYKKLSLENKRRIKILKEYEVPYHAYVFSPNLDEKVSKQITKILLNAKKNPATAKMFENVLKIEKWMDCDDEYYNPLRRYLRIVRVKPQMNVILTIKESAQKELEKRDDIITIIEDEIIHELKNEKRFSDEIGNQSFLRNYHELEVVLSLMDGEYHYQVHLNDNRITKGDIPYKDLSKLLPEIIVSSVLENLHIEAELLNNGQDWFITYGSNDGIDISKYLFELVSPDAETTPISGDKIAKITPLNIIFKNLDPIKTGSKIIIKYKHREDSETLASNESVVNTQEESFWDNKDNLWGVIGLSAALLTGIFGMYFTRRKQKRFRNLLYQSNNLLKEYIESQYTIDTKIIEQTELIRSALEKGYINETQFMILNSRIEEIQKVIDKHAHMKTDLSNWFEDEMRDVFKDGKITEKEFTKIFAMLNQNKSETDLN